MDTSEHNLSGLFKQLGLANGKAEIEAFLREHRLAEGQALPKAPFWNKAQAQFLSEALAEKTEQLEDIADEASVSKS